MVLNTITLTHIIDYQLIKIEDILKKTLNLFLYNHSGYILWVIRQWEDCMSVDIIPIDSWSFQLPSDMIP